MQQRVGIARAFVNDPEYVFADEPTAHLDEKLARRIYKQLKEQCAQLGTTTFVITHEKSLLPFADRVITLVKNEDGQGYGIQEMDPGKLQEIREQYPLDPEHHIQDRNEKPKDMYPAKPIYRTQLVVEMFFEAFKEMRPLGDAILYYGFVKWFGRFSATEDLFGVKRPPLYLYLSNLSSILICSLLFAMAFLFHSLNSGIQAYQDSVIQQQEYFRQSIVIPSNSTNQKMQLDLDEIQSLASAESIDIESVDQIFDLGGYAMLPKDVQYIGYEKEWPAEMLQNFRHQMVNDVEESRLQMRLIAFEDGDLSLLDYGISTPILHKSESLPKIFIRNNEHEWTNLGAFDSIPKVGESVYVVFESDQDFINEVKQVRESDHLCVAFEVAGYSKLQKPKLALAQRLNRIGSRLYHGVIASDVQQQILTWQLNSTHPDATIPEDWHCPKYQTLNATRTPTTEFNHSRPSAYRFTMVEPQDILVFQTFLDGYALERTFSLEFISEFELIQSIERYKSVVNSVGFVLASIPILLCAVFILLTVQTVITRKSQDLLLYRVMGAPSFALYLQSFIFALFIIVPGIVVGLALASFAPQFLTLSNDFVSIPGKLVEHIQHAQVTLSSLGMVLLITFGCILVTSWISVLSVLDENPTNVFRGG